MPVASRCVRKGPQPCGKVRKNPGMRLRNLASAVVVGFSLQTLAAAGGQAPEAFEVVAIRALKPSPGDIGSYMQRVLLVGDRLQATNITALGLIHAAYEAEYTDRDQIVDADGWVASDRFSLEARAASVLSETPTSTLPPRVAMMLRRVLQERFQLRVRRETRELQRLVLNYAQADRSLKKGIRISDQNCPEGPLPATGTCSFSPMPGKLSMRGQPIKTLTDFLSIPAYSGGRVIDGTGITDRVDVDLEWVMTFKDLPSSTSNLWTAVQEQLGLKLESRRISMPALVIEHIQRPSGN